MTKPHKNAEFFRAIADGVPLSEFEARSPEGGGDWAKWRGFDFFSISQIANDQTMEIRRKQKSILVNGFEVPEPCQVIPEIRMPIFIPSIDSTSWYFSLTMGNQGISDEFKLRIMHRGLVHLNPKAAIAHAKAMLGIDPNAPKEVADVSTSAAGGGAK